MNQHKHGNPEQPVDLGALARRRQLERDTGVTLPAIAHDLRMLRDCEDEDVLTLVLERVVVLGPTTLELEPLLRDAIVELLAHYAATIGPWTRTVRLNPYVPLPDLLLRSPRVAAVLSHLQGRSLAWVLQECPLPPLETCAVLGLLHRLNALVLGAAVGDPLPPPELDQPFLPRALDPLYQSRFRLATALRAFQARADAMGVDYAPWAKCPFVRVPVPPPDPTQAAAVAVLIDALETPGCLQVSAGQWDSGELVARELKAYVFHLPVGPIELTLKPYVGTARSWSLTCADQELTLVCLTPSWRGWQLDVQTVTF